MQYQATLILTMFSFCTFSTICGADAELVPPNTLFLLSDDHRYPFLSCYGDDNVKTPAMDRLASEGIMLHRFITAAPQFVPSRAALMTGRSPVAARMTRISSPLPRDAVTCPELLREHASDFTGVCGRSFHLDGSGNRDGEGIAQLPEQHRMRTFAKRVELLNPFLDVEVVKTVDGFS
jgi:N-sulfoglucosamine sulfohydrolase